MSRSSPVANRQPSRNRLSRAAALNERVGRNTPPLQLHELSRSRMSSPLPGSSRASDEEEIPRKGQNGDQIITVEPTSRPDSVREPLLRRATPSGASVPTGTVIGSIISEISHPERRFRYLGPYKVPFSSNLEHNPGCRNAGNARGYRLYR
jgi:hypothetical protein